MIHLKLDTCESTQSVAKERVKHDKASPPFLISTKQQTQGIGRNGAEWYDPTNSLAMSLVIEAPESLSLAPLGIGASVCRYLQKHHALNVKLKWPNDILREGKKCGGIICQLNSPGPLLVGVGLNWGKMETLPSGDYKFPPGSLFPDKILHPDDYHQLAGEIATFIYHSDLSAEAILREWPKWCAHLNKKITFDTGKGNVNGIFRGISSLGEAQIESEGEVKNYLSGSILSIES